MRHWLLTWTLYGTWLPGDERGSVTAIREGDQSTPRIHLNRPGTAYVESLPAIKQTAKTLMKGPPIFLSAEQAEILLIQFLETANYRNWILDAVAIMTNHVHLVVTIDGDPEPEQLLRDFKSYGSRALNQRWGKPLNGTWWTNSGSKRKLPNESARHSAIDYVLKQHDPIVIWCNSSAVSTGEPTPSGVGSAKANESTDR